MGIAAVLDKAGPALASGIILAVLAAAGSSALAWRDLLSTSDVRFGHVNTDLERLRADLEAFRSPGGRFTAHDGDRHWARMDDLDRRLREQEMRPPRLTPGLDKAETRLSDLERRIAAAERSIEHIEAEQERLCTRLAQCRGNSK